MNRIKNLFFSGKRWMLSLIGVTALLVIAGGTAYASAAPTAPPVAKIGCVTSPDRTLTQVFENVPTNFTCTNGFAVSLSGTGTTGAQGATGATGPQGPSGVVSTGTTDLGAVGSVPTGGSFVSHATQVGTINLVEGTYLVNLNAKATPSSDTGSVQVFPQFFVYNQAANANFTGDLFNVGAGALESGANDTINSYYSGSSEIVVPVGGETLHVYAFGYDSDTSAGAYALNDLTVTATQINAAS
jgi:hypothetical protein